MAKKKGLTIMPQGFVGVIKRANKILNESNALLPSNGAKRPFYFVKNVNDTISELSAGIGEVKVFLKGLSSDSEEKGKYETVIDEMTECKAKLEALRTNWQQKM